MIPLHEEMKGKVVIVTGGSKGIGKGCAQVFCEVGAHVVMCGRNAEDGAHAEREIQALGGGECTFYRCNVANDPEVKALVDFTVEKYGKLDCIVNNAGYNPPEKSLDDTTVEDIEAVFRVNFFGLFSGCKYALPHLRKTKGTIINMSSVLAITGIESAFGYTATKGAICTFTKSLAIDEAKNGVRVNALLPGNTLTEMYYMNRSREPDPEEFDAYSNQVQWMGRGGESVEMGKACLFLASSLSSFVTGIDLLATGGYEIGEAPKTYRMPWNRAPGAH